MFWLLACSPYPDNIPAEPGVFEAEMLADLWRASDPKTFSTLYSGIARGTYADETTPCPAKSKSDSGTFYEGEGCTDRWGTTWNGSLTLIERDGFAQLDDFGPTWDDWRGSGDWTADGKINWTQDNSTVDVTLEIALTYEGRTDWIEGTGTLASGSELSNRTGTIGLDGWGTTQLEHDIVALAGTNGCQVPSNGTLQYVGASQLTVELPATSACQKPDIDEPYPDICLEFGDIGTVCEFDDVPVVPQSADDPTGG